MKKEEKLIKEKGLINTFKKINNKTNLNKNILFKNKYYLNKFKNKIFFFKINYFLISKITYLDKKSQFSKKCLFFRKISILQKLVLIFI